MEVLLILLASANLLMARFALISLTQPTTLPLWLVKVFTSAVSPVLLLIGIATAAGAMVAGSTVALVIAIVSIVLYAIHLFRTSRPPETATNFESVFGRSWASQIPAKRKASFLRRRYVFWVTDSRPQNFQQNISFYRIPGTNRDLLCDVWEPQKEIDRSGVAFIYLHGSAWAVLDKDFGTRFLFRHLAAQGHVIMDVAYRLFPETDLMGMIHDAKRAIAWMRSNASRYRVDPDKIVIGGGSAGAHLALLAGYTHTTDKLTPEDLRSVDLSVRGVISAYGQSDLAATFYHTCQHLTTHSALAGKEGSDKAGMPEWVEKRMGKDLHRLGFDKGVQPGMLNPMLGGDPVEKTAEYALFSPITYVHKDCPATLIIHGAHDILAPVKAISQLYLRLKQLRVPVVKHIIPQTDHAFDLILPRISPSAQNALYDLERFLAVMASNETTRNVRSSLRPEALHA